MMDICIIISNYDPKGQLLSCINSTLAQNADAGEYEVIFPLHGKITGKELEQLQARAAGTEQLRLLAGNRHNRAHALNDAVRRAASDCLVFLESHVHAPPDLAASYRRLLQSPGIDAVQGAFAVAETANWVSETESSLRALGRQRRRARGLPADEFHLHSAGFKREAILAAGGFDQRVPGIAEVPLLYRIQQRGGRIAPLEAPAVHHVNHDDFRGYVQALRQRGREVGLLWQFDPGVASLLYPAVTLERHGTLVLRMRRPLRLAGEARLSLASMVLALSRALKLHRFTLVAAAQVASSAVRAGILEGYCV
jgi:hypothetical protein